MFETVEEYFKRFLELPKSDKVDKWTNVFNSMSVHTRKRIPTESLLARRPNEDKNIHDYRVANYRAITYGSMNTAMDDVYRIVTGISYSISVPDNVSELLNNHIISQYSNELHAETINIKVFIEKICLKRDIEDPNGFLIWMPTGAGLTDSSQKVIPEPRLICSSQFRYCDATVFVYLSEEKSLLGDGNGNLEACGDVYYFITKNEIWKNYQTGLKSDPSWKQEKIYTHALGAFPVIVLGGDMNAEGFYESYFAPYLSFGDEAIHQYSDWQAIMTTSSFPIKEMFGNEVKIKRVNKTSNNPSDNEEGYSGGSNGEYVLQIQQPNPYGIIERRIPMPNLNDDALPVDVPSIRYINPDIEIAKYSGESWQMLIKKAEEALNINMTVGLDQSGIAKQIDKEAQYAMISKIAANFFDNIYLNSLKMIDGYLNRKLISKSDCTIAKPKSFWVKSEAELVNEISQLKTSNAPAFFLQETTLDLAKKRFNGNPVKEKIFATIALYDPFYTYTAVEKNSMLASGAMTKTDYIYSLRMFTILNQIAEEVGAAQFLKKSYADIFAEFEKRIVEFIPEAPSVEFDDNGNPVNGQT